MLVVKRKIYTVPNLNNNLRMIFETDQLKLQFDYTYGKMENIFRRTIILTITSFNIIYFRQTLVLKTVLIFFILNSSHFRMSQNCYILECF